MRAGFALKNMIFVMVLFYYFYGNKYRSSIFEAVAVLFKHIFIVLAIGEKRAVAVPYTLCITMSPWTPTSPLLKPSASALQLTVICLTSSALMSPRLTLTTSPRF
jgi:hypothetical protein